MLNPHLKTIIAVVAVLSIAIGGTANADSGSGKKHTKLHVSKKSKKRKKKRKAPTKVKIKNITVSGPSGPQGPSGLTGATGATGKTGATGPAGAGGHVGAPGSPGSPGGDGAAGREGAPGSNAVLGHVVIEQQGLASDISSWVNVPSETSGGTEVTGSFVGRNVFSLTERSHFSAHATALIGVRQTAARTTNQRISCQLRVTDGTTGTAQRFGLVATTDITPNAFNRRADSDQHGRLTYARSR